MKLRYITLVVVLVLQVFLAVTPLFPQTSSIWHRNDTQLFNGILATFIGIEFTLLTTTLAILQIGSANEFGTHIAAIESKFPPAVVRRLRDTQFYTGFRAATENAKHSVRICYFAPYPPADMKYSDRNKYYKDMLDLMKRRQDLTFRRIVRDTPANRQWVGELIGELQGKPNNEIAILKDGRANETMPIALSVQVVDEEKSWVVAIDTHEREGEFRDIYIENSDVALGMASYFDRLWSKSTVVLDHGRLTPDGTRLLDTSQSSDGLTEHNDA